MANRKFSADNAWNPKLANRARQMTVFWRESVAPGVVDADEMDSHVA